MSKDKTLKTISYQFTPAQYELISKLATKENRSMRRMLFHAVEFYIYKNNITLDSVQPVTQE